jgi:erythronate-4-phosphate dehydrogenase
MQIHAEKEWWIPNRLEALAEVAKELFDWLANLPLSSRAKYSAGLALEEMGTNIIKYGYDDDGEHLIHVRVLVDRDHVTLEFEDDGHPFDPTQRPPPDIETLVDSQMIGGLGIELVRRMSAKMAYKRDGDTNRLVAEHPPPRTRRHPVHFHASGQPVRPVLIPRIPLLAGCATPAKRIEQNQDLFDSLPVAAQARIRGGQIDLGFTPDMVRIALGEPQRKLVRRTAAGETEIWLYSTPSARYDRQRADIDGLSLSGPGGARSLGGSAWINVKQNKEFVRTRAEFQNGVAVAIEEPARPRRSRRGPPPRPHAPAPMKIVCASSVLHAREAFSGLGDVVLLPDRDIRREHLLDADALIVRSKTRVGPDAARGTPVGFVATATAGADHFDIPWLNPRRHRLVRLARLQRQRRRRIRRPPSPSSPASAPPSCPAAPSASSASARSARASPKRPPSSACASSATTRPSPSRPATATSCRSTLLPAADILTLHVPLESAGPFPTRHLADCRLFDKLKPGAWFLNTSRGAVTDSDSLQCALDHHLLSACALDVWEKEPELPEPLKHAVDFLTPHIAGYSLEGLLNGTLHCHRELCHFLEIEPPGPPTPASSPRPLPRNRRRPPPRRRRPRRPPRRRLPHPRRRPRLARRNDHHRPRRTPPPLRPLPQELPTSRREFAAIRVHLAHASPPSSKPSPPSASRSAPRNSHARNMGIME